jgi:hypothetical protein
MATVDVVNAFYLIGRTAKQVIEKRIANKQDATDWFGGAVRDFTAQSVGSGVKLTKVFSITPQQRPTAVSLMLGAADKWAGGATTPGSSSRVCWLNIFDGLKGNNAEEWLSDATQGKNVGFLHGKPTATLDVTTCLVAAWVDDGMVTVQVTPAGGESLTVTGRRFGVSIWRQQIGEPLQGHIAYSLRPRVREFDRGHLIDNMIDRGNTFLTLDGYKWLSVALSEGARPPARAGPQARTELPMRLVHEIESAVDKAGRGIALAHVWQLHAEALSAEIVDLRERLANRCYEVGEADAPHRMGLKKLQEVGDDAAFVQQVLSHAAWLRNVCEATGNSLYELRQRGSGVATFIVRQFFRVWFETAVAVSKRCTETQELLVGVPEGAVKAYILYNLMFNVDVVPTSLVGPGLDASAAFAGWRPATSAQGMFHSCDTPELLGLGAGAG